MTQSAAAVPMIKISNSELQAYKRCKRKWWLTYYWKLRLRREGVGALTVGNMIHHPLEFYYADPQRNPETFNWEGILAAYVQERQNDPRLPSELHPQLLEAYELAKLMLKGYFEWLQEDGMDSEFRVVAAEQEIEVYLDTILGTQVFLISKLDTIVQEKSSGLFSFMDHKSVQNLKDLAKGIGKNEQFRYYGLIQRMKAIADGGPPGGQFAHGGMLNMLRKVKRTAAANPPFYGRAATTHPDEVYRTFHARVWGEVFDLLTTRARLDSGLNHHQVVYPTPTRDCEWDCPFNAICTQFDDGSDVSSVIAAEYEPHDPLERYTEVEKG